MHPSDARARLLFEAVCEPTVAGRLAEVGEELRVARLVAHMRPYLPSSQTARTQPMPAVVPVQRRATHPAEQRLDDITVTTRRRAQRGRSPFAVPTVPYSGGTR